MKLENNNTKIKFSTKELFMGLDCSDSIYLEDFTIVESNKNFLEHSKNEINQDWINHNGENFSNGSEGILHVIIIVHVECLFGYYFFLFSCQEQFIQTINNILYRSSRF